MILKPTGTINLSVTRDMQVDNTNNLYVLCQTNAGAVTINLPRISSIAGVPNSTWGFRIFVTDDKNNASVNNITIVPNPADKINGSSSPIVLNTNGATGHLLISGFKQWEFASGAGAGANDVKTVTLKDTQIFPLVMADPDDFDGNTLWTDASMVNANGRSVAIVMGVVNNSGNTITATLWNVTDDVAFSGVPTSLIPSGGTEISVGITANPSPAFIGKQIGVKLTGIAGGTYQILSGGIGIADIVVNFLPSPTLLYPVLQGSAAPSNGLDYVSKSSIGILRGLSTQTFSADVVAFHQGTNGFQEATDNFGALVLTQANADTAPTLATATTIKSDVGLKINSFAFAPSLTAGRMALLFSYEQYVAGL